MIYRPVSPSPDRVVRAPETTRRARRFPRIYYERLMSEVDHFSQLFDNVSPFFAQRIWNIYFKGAAPIALEMQWRRLGRVAPLTVGGRAVWFDTLRRLFQQWCESQGLTPHMDFQTVEDEAWLRSRVGAFRPLGPPIDEDDIDTEDEAEV